MNVPVQDSKFIALRENMEYKIIWLEKGTLRLINKF